MKKPLVSVIVPSHNSERTIKKCLLSIKEQTYPNIEIIVVDSPYYDKEIQKRCKKIIERYARFYKDGPERSIQRNRAIKEAKGEYILSLDQDMYATKDVISECVNEILNSKYVALNIPEISIGEGFWTKCVALERYISTFLEDGLNESCRFFRKKDAVAIGYYDTTIVGIEDSDFHYKMEKKGTIGKIKSYINHDEGKTNFFGRVRKKYYYSIAFREYLRRYPSIAIKQFFPFKKAYIKHWRILICNPVTTFGVVVLRSAEVVAGLLGMIVPRFIHENKQF